MLTAVCFNFFCKVCLFILFSTMSINTTWEKYAQRSQLRLCSKHVLHVYRLKYEIYLQITSELNDINGPQTV